MDPSTPPKDSKYKPSESFSSSKKAALSRSEPTIDVRANYENITGKKIAISKGDPRYWSQAGKLRKWPGSATFSMETMFRGRRVSITTRKSDKQTAARIAAGIYNDLVTLGVDATLIKHSASTAPSKGDEVATIGEWIAAAQKVSAANDATFTAYARALRTIAGGIADIKKTKKRFGPKQGGSSTYRGAIDSMSLDSFTLEAIQKWRLAYVKKAKNPLEERSAKISCNSLIRQARSLFAEKVVRFLPLLRLPELPPFSKVEFYERQNTKYFSKIDAPAIVQAANTELAQSNQDAFLAFLLAIGAGLRRAEIDTLCWHQIDTKRHLIRLENTAVASLKTDDSRAEVAIDEKLAAALQGYRALKKAKDRDFVIKGDGAEGKKGWGQHYRANTVFNALIKWLRDYEQDGGKPLKKIRKPIHELRKELGALITSKHGIYAASHTLRHSTVATTAAYYADKKERTTVDIGGWLEPENVISIPDETTPQAKGKNSRRKKSAA